MRWVAVLLLIVNGLYFGWELDRETRLYFSNKSNVWPVPADVRRLQLLSEVSPSRLPDSPSDSADNKDTGQKASSDTNAAQTDVMIESSVVDELLVAIPPIETSGVVGNTGEPVALCFSYGPFPDKDQTLRLLGWFQDQEVDAAQRFEQDTEDPLLWIYLAPQGSRDSAMQALEELKEQGVKDYHLIETGSLQNAISLGLFSTQAAVNRRLNELKDKGYQPVVVPYRDTGAIFWIDVRLDNDEQVLNRIFTGLPARFNSVPVNCGEIALP